MVDIWILVQQRDGEMEAATYGLATEAKRLTAALGDGGQITAVSLGPAAKSALESLGTYGVNRVLHATSERMTRYQGERFGRALFDLVQKENPACLLMAQSSQTEDLAQRLGSNDEDGPCHASHGFFHDRRRRRPSPSSGGQWVSLRIRITQHSTAAGCSVSAGRTVGNAARPRCCGSSDPG